MAGEEGRSREASDDVPDTSHMSDEEFQQLIDQYWAEQPFDIRSWVRASRSSRSTPEPTRETTTASWLTVTVDGDGIAHFSVDSGRSGLEDVTSGVSILDLLDDTGGSGSGGATPASSMAIVNLPEMTVGDEKGQLENCPVCLEGFEEGDKLRKMPCSDSHCFHEQCIFNWLLINRHCPLCRFALPAETEEMEEEEEVVQAENDDDGED